MKLSDITAALAEESGLDKAKTAKIIDGLFAKIKTAVESGEKVNVPGMGSFLLKERAAGEVVSPKSGLARPVAAARFVTFKPAVAGDKSKKAAKAEKKSKADV